MQRSLGDIKRLGWKVIYDKFPWVLVTCPEVKTAFHFHDIPKEGWYLRMYTIDQSETHNRCNCPFPPNLNLLLNLVDD